MPDIADVAWSERDDHNTEAVPNGWPTGAFPAYSDLVGQMMMGATKRFWNKINPVYQTSGTGDNYIVQTEVGIDQINLYELLCVRIDRTNTTSTPTLQFGATNSRVIVKVGASGYVPLAAGDMFAGNSHTFWYNGAFYVLTDPALIVGSTVQPYSPNLTTWAAITRPAGFDTWVATPTSANLAALVGDETGSGKLVFATGPTLSAPLLAGGTSGTTTLQASPVASGVLTLPAATDTLVGRATTDTLTNKTINGSNNTITNVSLTTGVTGTLPIGNGGTGQITAAAGFDALSPTTTRGDLIFRNASTNARLAASTAGYLLQTNGAGTDPTWSGFLQAGTSAVTRTWASKVQERVSVKDFGAAGDGVTNDTTAIQAAETYRASIGGELYFPPGDYLIAGITVNRANGGAWRASGNVRLLPNADSVILIDVAGAVVSPTTSKVFTIDGLELHFNSHASVTGYREASPYLTHITRCKFNRLQFSCILNGSAAASQTGWVTISDIDQIGEGSWLFRSADDSHYIFNINVNNFNQQGTGASPWTGTVALFQLSRATSIYLNNVNAGSLDGAAKGVYMSGDCQGVFLNNVIIGWPTYGVHSVAGTDTLIPSYIYINNCGMDQPTTKGFDIAGRSWRITNTNATNGYLRSSTGAGLELQATATDIAIEGFLAAYMNHDGIKVNTGATKVTIAQTTSENNNQIAGSNYDLNLTGCTWVDVFMDGRNYIGSAGVNATAQRIVNGRTSPEVSRNTGSVSTTAVTTQQDLMTYSIPANTLKAGQKVRLTAWGTTAANANGKTVRLWFGANSVIDHNGTWSAIPWKITADIFILTTGGAATQEYNGVGWPSANVQTARQGTASNADNVAITVKATGQNAVASAGDITCEGFTVEIID